MKIFSLFYVFINLSICASCVEDNKADFIEATVVYSGSPSVDGCGWLIKIKDDKYSPINFPEEFKDSQHPEIFIQYTLLDDYFCGWWGDPAYQKIEILNIKKR